MKKLVIIFLIAIAAIKGYSQGNPKTDAELKVLFDVIRNETATGGNTKTRVANAYQALADSKISTKDAIVLSGTNTYSGTVTGLTSYTQFDKWPVQFTNANSGASTVNLNSIGAIALKKNGSSALVSGDINAGQFFWLVYDGTNFQLIGGGSGGGVGTVTNVTSTSADLTVANGTTTPALIVISAPKWTTARTLNGLSIDGSVNVSGAFTAGSTGAGFTIALGTSTKTGTLPLVNGGLETSLSAPASSKILGYDITDATNGYWTVGSNLSYDHATHTLSASGGSGGGVSGLTTNRIPYAANSTTLIDDAAMTWDATNKVPTFNNARLVSNGTNGIKGFYLGYQAGNFTAVTVSNGGNTGFGYQVFSSITDGVASFDATANTAFGYQALKANTNASNLTAFGYKALAAETSSGGGSGGWNQTAIGANALAAVNGGYQNVAIGDGAMKIASTPFMNVAIGSDAMSQLTTGNQNTGVGDLALGSVGAGGFNTAVGSECLETTTASANSGLGYLAGVYVSTGTFNTVIGTNAGGYVLGVDHSLTTGSYNTFIGANTGNGVATTQFDYSSALGASSFVTASRMMAFGDNGANRPNYGFGGASFGGGFGVMYLANYSTVPTSAPTGGSFFYSDAGIMKLWNAGAGSGVAIGTGVSFPLSSSQLVINNPANTFAYTFTAQAIGGARTITLPLLAASDVMVTADFTQTLTNKTLASSFVSSQPSALDASLKIAPTKYVDDAVTAASLGPFSTTAAGYTNLSGAAGSLLKGDNTWLAIGSNTFVLTSNGTTFSWAAPSGGGITNAAANTEVPLSNGTNLIASTLFYASRTLTLGTAAAGATVTLQADGSATDVGFNFFNKGAGQFQFNGTGSTLANHFFNQVNSLTVNHYSTNATGVFLVLSKFRGTGASPTTDANGDVLGNLDFQGYDGTSTINSARIKAVLNGTISTGVTPTDIVFQTTATNTVVDAMKISSLGVVSLTGNATQAGQFRLYEDTDDGTNFSSFKVGVQAGDLSYTLPNAVAASDGSYMSTTTGGVMSWTEALTPSNGLTTTSTTLKLGGALTANTTISGAFDLTFTNNNVILPSAWNSGSTSVNASGNTIGIGGAFLTGASNLAMYNGTITVTNIAGFSIASIAGDPRVNNANGVNYSMGGSIKDYIADVNNGTTVETDLYTFTTIASTLSTDGDKLYVKYSGTFNDVTATSQLKVYFGGTAIGDTGALTVSATGGWEANACIIRTSSTTVRATVSINTPGASTALYTKEIDVTGLTLSNTNIVKITGQAGGGTGGSSDITAKFGSIVFIPAAP